MCLPGYAFVILVGVARFGEDFPFVSFCPPTSMTEENSFLSLTDNIRCENFCNFCQMIVERENVNVVSLSEIVPLFHV